MSSPDSTTVALQISVICEHSKCLFHSGRHPWSCMCQHSEGNITLCAWLATCISVWLLKCWASRTDGWVPISRMDWNTCGASLSLGLLCCCLWYKFVSYRLSSKFWRIVINISDSDDSSCCVGEAVHGVALHVSGLDDQCVLGHFLEGRGKETIKGLKTSTFYSNDVAISNCSLFCCYF